MSETKVRYTPITSQSIDRTASPFKSAVQLSTGSSSEISDALAGVNSYNPQDSASSDLKVYIDVAEIQKNEIPKTQAAFKTAEDNYNAVKNNPNSTQGEITKATNEYNGTKHAYELSKELSANSTKAAEEAKADSERRINQVSDRQHELSGLLSGRIKGTSSNNGSTSQKNESGFTLTA